MLALIQTGTIMEYRIATTLLGLGKRGKETYVTPGTERVEGQEGSEVRSVVIGFVIAEVVFYILIGTLSAYLSWSSNASIGWNPVFCFIFSLIAFFCAILYLISHILFKMDLLYALKVIRQVVRPIMTPAAAMI